MATFQTNPHSIYRIRLPQGIHKQKPETVTMEGLDLRLFPGVIDCILMYGGWLQTVICITVKRP